MVSLDDMRALGQDRQAKRDVWIVRDLPDLREIPYAWLGTFTTTTPATRYIRADAVVKPLGLFQTETELARDYLSVKYADKRLRAMALQRDLLMQPRHPPQWAMPNALTDAIYIDLKAAYWQILLCFGWGVDYYPGEWVGVKDDVFDFPFPKMKLARNSLVVAGLPTPNRVWVNGRVELKQSKKRVNMGIWALAQDVLHLIASKALAHNAHYVNADGYIFATGEEQGFCDWLDRVGLVYRVKAQGKAVIKGVGAYRIGKHVSGLYGRVMPHTHLYLYEPLAPDMLENTLATMANLYIDRYLYND